MSKSHSVRARRRPRRLVWSALVAVMMTIGLSAVPGTASATTTQKVTPLLDCYFQNADNSITVILGYTSTYNGTKNIPIGTTNNTNPISYQPQMPTSFKSGTYHGVVSVRLPQSVLYQNPYWYLDGTRLDYRAAAYTTGICSSSQLPALANGAALALGLIAAGGVGYVIVRRSRRAAGEADGA